jgi:inhibitor of the pro-sigma K processing machinery
MDLDVRGWFIIGISGILLFSLLTRSIKKPFVLAWYSVIYSVVGGIVLFVINFVGQYIHLTIPINLVTAFITGALGLPGVLYLVVVKLVFIGG